MRVHELILSRAVLVGDEPGRLLVHEGADVFVTNPIVAERMTVLPAAGETPRGNDVVLALVPDPLAVGALLAEIPDGVSAALVLTVPIDEIPVGAVLDAVLSAGAQVRDFVPVQSRHATCVLIAVRGEPLVAPAAYLRPDAAQTDLNDGALKRLIAEWVVDGAVTRAKVTADVLRIQNAEREVAELRAQLDAARADNKRAMEDLEQEIKRTRRQLEMVESSTALHAGRALVDMHRHPLRGSRMLTRALRTAFARKRSADN
jgi:hypothetical protein